MKLGYVSTRGLFLLPQKKPLFEFRLFSGFTRIYVFRRFLGRSIHFTDFLRCGWSRGMGFDNLRLDLLPLKKPLLQCTFSKICIDSDGFPRFSIIFMHFYGFGRSFARFHVFWYAQILRARALTTLGSTCCLSLLILTGSHSNCSNAGFSTISFFNWIDRFSMIVGDPRACVLTTQGSTCFTLKKPLVESGSFLVS